MPNDNEQIMRAPTNDAEAEEILIQTFNGDSDKIEAAAKRTYEEMMKVANKLRENQSSTEQAVLDSHKEMQQNLVVSEDQSNKNEEEKSEVIVKKLEEKIIPIPQPKNNHPPGYLPVPEGLFFWSPEIWGGRPLHCVPKNVIEREGRVTLIVMLLVSRAFGRTRSGRIVDLPEGSNVVVHSSTHWAPIIPMCKGPEGRPVLWVSPSTMDPITNKIRPSDPGDQLLSFDTGDGGKEYGLIILYDPDPKDPTKPRLIDLETVNGVKSNGG